MTLSELENYIESIDAAKYAKTRNYIDGSTRLSEYITRGFISLPRVQELIPKNNSKSAAFKLLSELSWREYFQHTWRIKGDDIFKYIRPLKQEPRRGIPVAVLESNTGITALDNAITQLRETGYISNHERMWLAGLICNVAQCDWQIAADWMHTQLIDGDYASNHLSWQWVAGSLTGSAYLPQQGNINTYTHTEQTGTYLDTTYAQIADMPVPPELEDITAALPTYSSKLPEETISLQELQAADTVLLYSPWTLDPTWRQSESGTRVLVLPKEIYKPQAFSQHVIDSIIYFANKIDDLHVMLASQRELDLLAGNTIYRKDYPGIRSWPGKVDNPELLHPEVPNKFYPSYSAYWKAIKKHTTNT